MCKSWGLASAVNVKYKHNKMTEDAGKPLKDGETRLCDLNLARTFGEQGSRFSSELYVSWKNPFSGGFGLEPLLKAQITHKKQK